MPSLTLHIEALLLTADSPIATEDLAHFFDLAGEQVEASLQEIATKHRDTALFLQQTASGWRLCLRKQFSDLLARFYATKPQNLSPALLETLAIIAYQQPVTRADIEHIRGVTTSSHIISNLLDLGWIQQKGKKVAPGRPALFATTSQLLDDLGLCSLADLPPIESLALQEQSTQAH